MSNTVSVVIPTYNRAATIVNAVQSVLRQSYGNVELIVIDDGSVDGTESAVAPFKDRIKYHHQTNGGVSSARNAGLDRCTGEFVSFLDSDDTWEPEKLSIQVDNLLRHPEAVADVCDAMVAGPPVCGGSMFAWHAARGSNAMPAGLLDRPFSLALRGWFYTSSWLIRRSAIRQKFTLGSSYCEDLEFISSVATQGCFHMTSQILVKSGWGQGEENLRSVVDKDLELAEKQRLSFYRRVLLNPSVKGDDRRFLERIASGLMQRLALSAEAFEDSISLSFEALRLDKSVRNLVHTAALPLRRPLSRRWK